ncbi:hypothetical protein HELRODRAFT_186615 [Helobdella robusta]|uniref:G-protein coupled receptors family 1 profile domain-containing protein n=1 Tax=Helobdella robusta TaxID=6412 RepID=T1FP16_HELRO|nr:hypothetical protein HELRODRAFT_186615 [Helobdella robusta]ESN90545.1 hypothetical protein HELRODRAFT_186615 [Helobdella robusta]
MEHLNKLFLEYIFPSDYEWLLIAMYLIVFIVGVVGNFLVCFAVWRNKQMRTVTNIFIFNLSTADLMVIILVLPATVTVDVTETWFAGLIMCKCLMFLQNISVSVSVLTLTAISVERFYAICHPLRFRSTKKRARMVIGAIWLFSILVSSHEAIIFQTIPTSNHTVLLTSCRPPNEYFDQSICYHAVSCYYMSL